MPANWLSNSSDVPQRLSGVLEDALQTVSQPANARRLRQVLLALFVLWGVLAMTQLIWGLLPSRDLALPETAVVINPVTLAAPSDTAQPVNIEQVQGWHLFGEAGATVDAGATEPEPEAAAAPLEGIEKGARKTRLDLKLRGIVASTDDGLGYAIIEHKSRQDIYAVEDKLPVSGQVLLAKVMPGQVVLDNGGTYELLQLFGESPLDNQLVSERSVPEAPKRAAAVALQAGADSSAADLARGYRQRLYENPQTLAEVVTISAVREDGQLLGYRVAPGKDKQQFEQLGFKPGDLVTSVNGIELNDPANTLRLYQAMRSASEAVFDLQRNEQPVTISVSLAGE